MFDLKIRKRDTDKCEILRKIGTALIAFDQGDLAAAQEWLVLAAMAVDKLKIQREAKGNR